MTSPSPGEQDGPVVQLVRTLACHARGRRFEPVPGRHMLLWLSWQSTSLVRTRSRVRIALAAPSKNHLKSHDFGWFFLVFGLFLNKKLKPNSDLVFDFREFCNNFCNFSLIEHTANPCVPRLNSDKVLFSIARGRERCDRNGHAVFLRPGVDFATADSEITGISTSSTKLK